MLLKHGPIQSGPRQGTPTEIEYAVERRGRRNRDRQNDRDYRAQVGKFTISTWLPAPAATTRMTSTKAQIIAALTSHNESILLNIINDNPTWSTINDLVYSFMEVTNPIQQMW